MDAITKLRFGKRPFLQSDILCIAIVATLENTWGQTSSLKVSNIPQTVAFEQFLLTQVELPEVIELATEQVRVIRRLETANPLGVELISGDIGIGLSFVDLTALGIKPAGLDKLLLELNEMYAFGADSELSSITFCQEDLLRPFDLLAIPGRNLQFGGDGDDVFGDITELLDDLSPKVLSGTIPIYLFDGTEDALGFASSFPHSGATDAVFAAAELLGGEIPHRNQGKTIGQLLANYIGLKPIWYQETPYGDLIDDTPCHNAPNYGTFEPGEVHYSMCDGMPREILDNFMDNTEESQRTAWTTGQITRIQKLLSLPTFRGNLVREPCSTPQLQMANGVAVSANTPSQTSRLELRPNPVAQRLEVEVYGSEEFALSGQAVVSVRDASGRAYPVQRAALTSSRFELNVMDLPPGTYYLTVYAPTLPNGERVQTQVFYKL